MVSVGPKSHGAQSLQGAAPLLLHGSLALTIPARPFRLFRSVMALSMKPNHIPAPLRSAGLIGQVKGNGVALGDVAYLPLVGVVVSRETTKKNRHPALTGRLSKGTTQMLSPECTCSNEVTSTNEMCATCTAEFTAWVAVTEEMEHGRHAIYVSHDRGWMEVAA